MSEDAPDAKRLRVGVAGLLFLVAGIGAVVLRRELVDLRWRLSGRGPAHGRSAESEVTVFAAWGVAVFCFGCVLAPTLFGALRGLMSG